MPCSWPKEGWAQKNKDLLARFNAATHKATDFVIKNPSKLKHLATKYLKTKPAIAAKIHWNIYKKDIDIKGLQWISDLALKRGLIKKKQDVRTFVFKE